MNWFQRKPKPRKMLTPTQEAMLVGFDWTRMKSDGEALGKEIEIFRIEMSRSFALQSSRLLRLRQRRGLPFRPLCNP